LFSKSPFNVLFKSQEAEDVKLEFGAVYKAKIEEIR
jgi:hypothetical protein